MLLELCTTFEEVGPALAALRMSPIAVSRVFPPESESPPLRVRRELARWLDRAGARGDVAVLADTLVGAAEARGFLSWVGSHLVDERSHPQWARDLARETLPAGPLPPS